MNRWSNYSAAQINYHNCLQHYEATRASLRVPQSDEEILRRGPMGTASLKNSFFALTQLKKAEEQLLRWGDIEARRAGDSDMLAQIARARRGGERDRVIEKLAHIEFPRQRERVLLEEIQGFIDRLAASPVGEGGRWYDQWELDTLRWWVENAQTMLESGGEGQLSVRTALEKFISFIKTNFARQPPANKEEVRRLYMRAQQCLGAMHP